MHLLKYFLKLNDLYIDQIEYEFGNVWLANTTIVYIKNLSKPINK